MEKVVACRDISKVQFPILFDLWDLIERSEVTFVITAELRKRSVGTQHIYHASTCMLCHSEHQERQRQGELRPKADLKSQHLDSIQYNLSIGS